MAIDKSSSVTCNGGNDGQTYVTAAGGTAPYTYVMGRAKLQIPLTTYQLVIM